MPPGKFYRIRCSKMASVIIFGPKLATTLMRTFIVHTALDSLGHRLGQGIILVPGLHCLLCQDCHSPNLV